MIPKLRMPILKKKVETQIGNKKNNSTLCDSFQDSWNWIQVVSESKQNISATIYPMRKKIWNEKNKGFLNTLEFLHCW
jgi:hypothetical protein